MNALMIQLHGHIQLKIHQYNINSFARSIKRHLHAC